MSIASSSTLAVAVCNTATPIPPEVAQYNQYFAQVCGLPWQPGGSTLPCPAPNPPAVVSSSIRPQGATVELTIEANKVPAGKKIKKIWILAGAENSSGYWQEFWSHTSIEGREGSTSDPEYVVGHTYEFGIPGLAAFALNRVSIAYEDSDGKKTCWSTGSAAISTPSLTPPAGEPAVSAGYYDKVRDDFDRPATSPRIRTAPGDGIGPSGVWFSTDTIQPSWTVKIHANRVEAQVAPTGGFIYERQKDSNEKTFVMAQVRAIVPTSALDENYNVEVKARVGQFDQVTQTAPAYVIKLVKGLRDCGANHALIIYRIPSETDVGCVVGAGGVIEFSPPGGGTLCNTYPTLLGKEKPSTPGFSYPVWLQGELRNSGESETTIVATATWTDEGNVTRTCTFTRIDSATPGDLDGNPVGTRWGALFHEKSYVVPVFRAGDGTP